MTAHWQKDHFALFGLTPCFRIDLAQLENRWRTIAAEVHPDRYVRASDADKRAALMLATQANEAYRTLRSPVDRARYLLSLANIDTGEETNTSMPAEFLMQQMQWRENIEDAVSGRHLAELDDLGKQLAIDVAGLENALATALDQDKNLDLAALLVRKMRFLQKLGLEIDNAHEQALS